MFREAEGCYHKVLNLAALLNIPKLKAVPLLKLAELYDKKRNTEESNKYFGLLKELKEEVSLIEFFPYYFIFYF